MEYSSEIRGEQLNNSDASLSEAYSKTSLLSSDVKASRGIGSDICSLVTASLLVSFPLAILSILLAVLLLRFRIRSSQIDAPEFQPVLKQDEPGVYYITIASTTFVLLSSYSSTFAHVMIGYFMSLLSYTVAHDFLRNSSSRTVRLPTPYQFALLLGCLEGSLLSLWRYMRFSFRRRRSKAVGLLSLAAFVLLVANLVLYVFGRIIQADSQLVSLWSRHLAPLLNIGSPVYPNLST